MSNIATVNNVIHRMPDYLLYLFVHCSVAVPLRGGVCIQHPCPVHLYAAPIHNKQLQHFLYISYIARNPIISLRLHVEMHHKILLIMGATNGA